MKLCIKIAFVTCSVVVLLTLAFGGRDIFQVFSLVHYVGKQMKIGDKYLNSLTDKDIQAWIQRTQAYLNEDPTNFELGLASVPQDLQKLGILGIEEETNLVDYVWVGGMDNTSLLVERMTNGNFQVTAFYNMYSNRVIWPKR
ncbi:MAG TPA: hypothetical protein VME24_10550 [Alphaproteobacteria bacterium]|nr:hypothetical protein [Alphaproteobacteria bacterium]